MASLARVIVSLALYSLAQASYNETLLFQPLPNSMLLTQFQFVAEQEAVNPAFPQYTLFPRSLAQILEQTHTRELHLRFSQGWWDHESWGVEPQDGAAAGGIGVELSAVVDASTQDQAFEHWQTLAHALSGLFCASLNFIDVQNTAFPETVAGPRHAQAQSGWFMRGVLPGEPVCTENLTPFLKLLPCKGWSGIASLLDGHSLFDSQWQTMTLDAARTDMALQLNQSIASVFNVPRLLARKDNPIPVPLSREQLNCKEGHPGCLPQKDPNASWNIEEIFGKQILGACPLAQTSRVEVIAPGWTVSSGPDGAKLAHSFPVNDQLGDLYLAGPVNSLAVNNRPPISVDRSFTGAGQQNGGVRVVFTNNEATPQKLTYLEVLPWFMRTYLSTLQDPRKIITDLNYKGSQIRGRPTQLELEIELQPNQQAAIEYTFDKSLLFIEEYPPDANHGFEIPPGLVTTYEGYQTRTTSLLLSLPVPDFSMPYNVIILTSTVMTLPFSNILNMLIKVLIPESVGEPFAQGPVGKVLGTIKSKWQSC